jgi:hypothetical protein
MYGDVPSFMKNIPGMNKLIFIDEYGARSDFEAWKLRLPIDGAGLHFNTY